MSASGAHLHFAGCRREALSSGSRGTSVTLSLALKQMVGTRPADMFIERMLIAALLASASAAPSSSVIALAGRYSHHFREGQVNGPDYFTDDVAEIVPLDPTHAYVRLALSFYNGHTCSLAGVARAEGDTLVYHAPASDTFGGSVPCRLVIRRDGSKLSWSDGENSCKAHCGERGSLMRGSLLWSNHRSITYMIRLKASSDYRAAMAEHSQAPPEAAIQR